MLYDPSTEFGARVERRLNEDRLAWLTENRTHRLRVFFANRLGQASNLRIESNCTLLNIAAMPRWNEND